jgi:drug/metabolite transporter (DMT)-like permease
MNKYIMMVFAGACSYGILSTFVKLSFQEGYNPEEIAFMQALLGAITLWIICFCNSGKRNVFVPFHHPKQITLLFATGGFIGLTTYFYYLSVLYIPASVAIVLLMQFTWIGIGLDSVLSRKIPQLIELILSGLVVVGTALASGFNMHFEATIPMKGVLYALLSSLFYSLFIIGNNRFGIQMKPIEKSAILMTGSAVFIFVFNLKTLVHTDVLNGGLLCWAVFFALFGTIIPPVLFATGIPKIGVGVSSIIMTAELPVAIMCAKFILKEKVNGTQWLGILVMLVAIIYLKYDTGKLKKHVS